MQNRLDALAAMAPTEYARALKTVADTKWAAVPNQCPTPSYEYRASHGDS